LPDTKSGRSVRPLSRAALDVIAEQPRVVGNEFVFPGTLAGRPIGGIRGTWEAVAKAGGLPDDITPHTLRHSFASLAADLGYSEPTIAALVGHKGQSITSRYVHSADKVLLAAADEIARYTLELMGEPPAPAQVVELHRA
jgi:integrase